ncbi:MAG TPA: hypothetical protein DEA08_20960 [Planctomycetes bacterium]|nr:hypothetical protein [Planctomycetota bacterium]
MRVTTRGGGAPVAGRIVEENGEAIVLDSAGWRVRLPMSSILTVRGAEGWRIPLADVAESEALFAESRGDLEAAYRALADQLGLLAAAQKAGGVSAAEAGAVAEVALERLDGLAYQAGKVSDVVQRFARYAQGEVFTPMTRARAKTLLVDQLRTLGQLDLAQEQVQELGVLTRFYLIGPFDNERGRGFSLAYPPEKDPFDPAAKAQGKGLEIAWRPLPVERPPSGVVDLDELVRPNDQCLAYVVTYLQVERETPVALRLGSDEAAELWVNRVSLLERGVRREYSPDQDHVGVVLQPGWNEVLLKVADQTGDWRFRLRVTSPEGGPAAGVKEATLAEIKGQPAFPLGKAPRCEVARDGRATLAARVARFPQDARAWFQLGYLHYLTGGHDSTEHPDREAFKRAVELAPRQAGYRMFLASTLRAAGEFSVNAEYNAWRQCLEQVLAHDAEHPRARMLLADYYLDVLGNAERARELLEPVIEKHPRLLEARLVWRDVLVALARAPLARGELDKLCEELEERLSNEEVEVWPLQLLDEAYEEAKRRGDEGRVGYLLDQRFAADRSSSWTLLQLAERREKLGQRGIAEQLLKRALALEPGLVYLRLELSDFRRRGGDLKGAVAALGQAIELRPQDPELWERRGRLRERIADAAGARADFEQSLALDPKRTELRKYLAYLDRGKRRAISHFEREWVIEPEPLVAAARKHPLDKKRTHRVVLRQEVDRVNPDGTKSSWTQLILRVESREGATQLRRYGIGYESDQSIEVQRGRLYRADGTVSDAPVGSRRGFTGGEFVRRQGFTVAFPALSPGDILELRYRIDDQEQGFFGDYYGRTVAFQDQVVVDRMRFVLIAPRSRELYLHSPGGRVGKPQEVVGEETRTWVWEARGVAPLETEPNMPWMKEALPTLQVSSFKDWNTFSSWYWGLVKGQHEVDDAIRAKVAELVAGAKTTEDKIRRIYEFVVTEIGYSDDWEFGVHGFKPYNATKIFARRFGDCKDKATLIGTMLSVIGVEAHPVLIFGEDGRGREDLSLPLMSHFNHCISWVDFEGGIFLDGTAEYHPYKTLPSMDYGAEVVVITPKQALLKEIPFRGPMANGMKERHEVVLSEDGAGRVKSTLLGSGTFEVILREWMTTEGRRREELQPKVGRFYNGAKVLKVDAGDPVDLSKPLPVQVEAVIPRMLRPAQDGGFELVEMRSWLFDMVYLRGGKLSDLAADTQRTHDVVLSVPSGVEEAVRYVLPKGTRVRSLPKPVELKTSFGSYQRVYVRKPGGIEVQRVLRIETNRIPQAQYEAFRKFVEQIDRAERERPVIEQGGSEQ